VGGDLVKQITRRKRQLHLITILGKTMIFELKFFESLDNIPFGASRSRVRSHFGPYISSPETGAPGDPELERDIFGLIGAVTYIDDGFAFFQAIDAELVVEGRNLNKVPYERLFEEFKSRDPQLYCSAGFVSFKYGLGAYDEGEDSFNGPLRLTKAACAMSRAYADLYIRTLVLYRVLPPDFQVEHL